jgi:hypothetical protein
MLNEIIEGLSKILGPIAMATKLHGMTIEIVSDNNCLLSMPPNSQPAKPTRGGTTASQTYDMKM